MADYKSEDDHGNCIFCKISSKEFPPLGNGLIYEDDNYMAWLSPFPNTEGFTIVIPKEHYGSDVLKMPDEKLSEFIFVTKKVSKMLENYFDDVGRVGLIMEGTGVNHAHIKLFPMHGTEYMKKGEWKQFLGGNNKFFEKYEGYLMSNDGPKTDFDELEKLAENIRKST
ncbi:HIT family protein [Candidatus Woesearchaeota archaeon]|nr:HIT family protein [Candidatus Woesearchaeota archaeon]MCF7901600.1 HIT family protein [Candidatus Woesearchaeota archaeon]MCF8013527.1 HIT family protein [Candidatus Woesearchaeota archaeon]